MSGVGGKSVGGGRKWTHGVAFVLPSSGHRCAWRMRSGRATQLEMHVGNGLLVGSVSSLILASGADEKDKAELIAQGRAQIERQQAARLGLEVGGRLRVVDGEDESYTTADPEVKR